MSPAIRRSKSWVRSGCSGFVAELRINSSAANCQDKGDLDLQASFVACVSSRVGRDRWMVVVHVTLV